MCRHIEFWFGYFFLWIEAATHAVDAHLAKQRGDELFAADCNCRRYEAEGRMSKMVINKQIGEMG